MARPYLPYRDISRRLSARAVVACLAVAALLGASAPQPAAAALPLTQVGSGFTRPLYVTHAGDSRLFVVEQGGRIKIIGGGTFLDISGLVSQSGSERGLLGLAFHPNYASNGRFYVNYTRASDGRTIIAEYRRSSGNANLADPKSARTVLTIAQPYANHNGGWMGFKRKLLYIATGDGGGAGDPGNRAQSRSTLLGKILRINPLKSGSKPYTIPPKNPYVGKSGRDEIWSYGLRNPWRCSFDRALGRMWCADVGQNKWEEVNRHKTGKGINYGWRVMEGNACYSPPSGCNTSGKRRPIAVYGHGAFGGGNCAVTGGYVSRRSGAALYGKYVFGDYCSGRVWTIPAGFSGTLTSSHVAAKTSYLISSFGEGNDRRLYLADYGGGRIFRLNDS